MLDDVNLKQIAQQYVLQMGLFFLADIQEKINKIECSADEAEIQQELNDFKDGFDRRHQLLTINHILCKL